MPPSALLGAQEASERIQVQYPAWIPTQHPMTGRYQSVLRNVVDHLVTRKQAAELQAWFELPHEEGTDEY